MKKDIIQNKKNGWIIMLLIFQMFIVKSYASESIFKKGIQNKEYTRENLEPRLKENEKKFKIALIQSDDYPEYYDSFVSILNGLKLYGWIETNNITDKKNYKSNRELIANLKNKKFSNYLQITSDDFFSFGATEKNRDSKEFKKIMQNCYDKKYDLVVLLGTLASKEVLSKSKYSIPTVMDAVSDPIGSKLILSAEDSGKEYLTARVDQDQYVKQLRLFHDVIGFKKLGIIYENTENGRSYAAIPSVEKVAEERGIELIRSYGAMAEPTLKEYPKAFKMYLKSMDEICPQVDAIFLGVSGGLENENVENVVDKLIQYKMPSFTMEGDRCVKKGVMLGVSGKENGLYNAKKIVQILKGKTPRELNQKFEKPPRISINIKNAEIIDVNLPVDIIRSSDEIYTQIEGE